MNLFTESFAQYLQHMTHVCIQKAKTLTKKSVSIRPLLLGMSVLLLVRATFPSEKSGVCRALMKKIEPN